MTNELDMEPNAISKMLFEPILVPTNVSENDDISLLKFQLEEAELTVGFSSVLNLARFCGEQTHYVETSAAELFGQLIASGTWFGFDFEGETGNIYDTETLSSFLKHLETDLELSASEKIEFKAPNFTEAFRARLIHMLSEFALDIQIGVAEDIDGQLMLALLKEDMKNEFSLLAKTHQFVSSEQERAQISILTCESFEALGKSFIENVEIISAPQKAPEPIKPPNLRY